VGALHAGLDEAEQLANEQIVESEASGNRWVSGILGVLLGNVALWTGRPTSALEHERDAANRFHTIGDTWGETQARVGLVRALAAAGRVDDALAEIDASGSGSTIVSMTLVTRELVRAQVLVHIGDPGALAAALHVGGNAEGTFTLGVELRMMLGLALLQAGRIDEGLVELEAARSQVADPDNGPGAAARSALALGLVAAGDTDRALELAQQGIDQGTYLDRQGCELARAFALLQRGDPDAAMAFDAALEHVDRTEARLDQAIVRVARARAWSALGRPDAEEAEHDTRLALAALGHDLSGWDRVFKLAARAGALST
jgi:hypothetical protein